MMVGDDGCIESLFSSLDKFDMATFLTIHGETCCFQPTFHLIKRQRFKRHCYLHARRVASIAPFWYRGLFLSGAVLIYWYSPLLQQTLGHSYCRDHHHAWD